jgi:hypothetical protein
MAGAVKWDHAVVRQILDHLALPTAALSLRVPPDPPDAPAADQPHEWSYEPLFDDLPIPDPVLAELGPRGQSVPPGRSLPPDPEDSA